MEAKEKSIEKNYGSQIDSTVKTIEDHVEKKSATGVTTAINKWIEVLEEQKGLKPIAANLHKLKEAMENKEFKKVATLLETLGEETTKAAADAEGAEATKIKHLGKVLTTTSKAISKLV
jgi:hypothetical protein